MLFSINVSSCYFMFIKCTMLFFCFLSRQTHKTALLWGWALEINLNLTVYSNHFQHRLFWQMYKSLCKNGMVILCFSKGLVYCKIALDSRVVKLSRIKVQLKNQETLPKLNFVLLGLWTFQYTALVGAHSVNKSLAFSVSLPWAATEMLSRVLSDLCIIVNEPLT
jgi:hypothetical protein